MAGLGGDIAEVYEELGANASIVNRVPVITGERVLYDINAQATKPFIREHQLDASFPYDTQITTNDVILMTAVDRHYMVMNKTPEMFENEVVEWSAVLYLCNLPLTAHVVRPVEVRDAQSYNMIAGWEVIIDSPMYGLLSDRIFGTEIEQQSKEGGQFPIWKITLIAPKFYGVKPLDRLIISETEYYKIEAVESYYYPGAQQILLVEDTRPMTIIEDGDVYGGYND